MFRLRALGAHSFYCRWQMISSGNLFIKRKVRIACQKELDLLYFVTFLYDTSNPQRLLWRFHSRNFMSFNKCNDKHFTNYLEDCTSFYHYLFFGSNKKTKNNDYEFLIKLPSKGLQAIKQSTFLPPFNWAYKIKWKRYWKLNSISLSSAQKNLSSTERNNRVINPLINVSLSTRPRISEKEHFIIQI